MWLAMSKRMRVHHTILVAGVAAVLTLRAPPAHACGQGGNSSGYSALATIVIVGAVTDVGFSLFSAGYTLGGQSLPRAYGVAETLIAGPQFVLAVSNRGVPAWYTIWMAALSVHGIYTLIAPSDAPPDKPSMRVTPLGVSGRF